MVPDTVQHKERIYLQKVEVVLPCKMIYISERTTHGINFICISGYCHISQHYNFMEDFQIYNVRSSRRSWLYIAQGVSYCIM